MLVSIIKMVILLSVSTCVLSTPKTVLYQYTSSIRWRYVIRKTVEKRCQEQWYIAYMQANFKSIHSKYVNENSLYLGIKDIHTVSNVTVEELEKVLEGTGTHNLSNCIVECEQRYCLNAFILCAIIAQESAWGSSRRAVEDNNLAGIGVYETDSTGVTFPLHFKVNIPQ